jgi:hypothetical protein
LLLFSEVQIKDCLISGFNVLVCCLFFDNLMSIVVISHMYNPPSFF